MLFRVLVHYLLALLQLYSLVFFFFNDTATTEIYTYLHTLSLHDALPISHLAVFVRGFERIVDDLAPCTVLVELGGAFAQVGGAPERRSEEHTSELQSLMRISYAVFCLKKKTEI